MYFRALKLYQQPFKPFLRNQQNRMCDKIVVNVQENLQALAKRIPKILVQRAEEIFPALKKNVVSVLCMIEIVSSCSLLIAFTGVSDVVLPRGT